MPRSLRPWLLLAPALAVVLLLFLGGFGLGVAESFGYQPYLDTGQPLTLDAYRALVHDPGVRSGLLLTLRVAATATAVSAVLAVAGALLLRRTRRARRLATAVFQANLAVPHVVGAAAVFLLLDQAGLLSRALHAVHLTSTTAEAPVLVSDRAATGVTVEYVWKETPFIGVVVLAALQGAAVQLEDAARTLGAGAWQRLRFVLLPALLPALLSTGTIVFAYSFGSYEVPRLLGATYPTTLPVVAYQGFTDTDLTSRPLAQAVCVLIVAIITVLVVVAQLLARRVRR